jgi:putative SOS response-associated peptidase YedK
MCGRFVLEKSVSFIQESFNVKEVRFTFPASYNIAPGDMIAAIMREGTGDTCLERFMWGFIPTWAKEPPGGKGYMNARSETVMEKRSFSSSFRKRRCIIPASGYYEWEKTPEGKMPNYIFLKGGEPMALAGIHGEWTNTMGERIRTCAILTTDANDLLAPIHERMPVILTLGLISSWLSEGRVDPSLFSHMFQPFPARGIAYHRVSRQVNRPGYDRPECIEPAL